MKQLLKRRWVILVGAMVLVLAIGATAWAETGSTTTPSTSGSTDTTVIPQNSQPPFCGPGRVSSGCFGRGGFRGDDGEFQQFREQGQQRMQSILELVRDKMTDADKATLDSLQAQQKTQLEALQKARQDLWDTNEEIRSLIDKYLDAPAESTTS
ncbi:MAG: hypothetical protein A2W26_12355 [Acidobacteria bacterium RBG_16_64_8]|nr:MAG: hypothetical protein A2W26_12355 [Acidobacteria bacterium RBG_16_64_8]